MSNGKKETRRHYLRQKATEAMGEEAADELMESLPPFDWHDLATKDDLAAMEERQGREIDSLRQEVGGLRLEVRDEVGALRNELHSEFGSFHRDLRDFGLKITITCMTGMLGFGGLVLAATQIAP